MPQLSSHPVGAPCWVDLFTSDPVRSRAFYSDLFGWTSKEAEGDVGGYVNFLKDGVDVAGCMGNDGSSSTPDCWNVHLLVTDAAATCDAATDNGGTVYIAPMAIPVIGTMAGIFDPGGAAVGCWQPDTFTGFGIAAEAGTPAWFELHTAEYDRCVDFYRTVFGWDTHVNSDTPDLRYTVQKVGEEWKAGIMDASGYLPPGSSGYWAVYFGTDDADATVARAVELGGSVLDPAENTPWGRLAGLADPTGARFKLIQDLRDAPPLRDL